MTTKKNRRRTILLEVYWFCLLSLLVQNRGSVIYYSRLIPLSESCSGEKDGVLKIMSLLSLLIYRSCWVCFATDEDDRTAEWVRPCRCRGSTKWVHQACLQRWVDEKQRGNSTARVACPQCNAEYLIVFPKLGKKILKSNKDICDVIIHNSVISGLF